MKTKISLLLLFVLLFVSCKSTRSIVDNNVSERSMQTDSVHEKIEIRVKPVVVPQSSAEIKLTEDKIKSLPQNASYSTSSGRAHATITKVDDEIVFSADCDSVLLLLEHTTNTMIQYKNLNESLIQQMNSETQVVINEPTSWQWFQIHAFRVMLVLCVLIFSFKKIVPWLKLIKL